MLRSARRGSPERGAATRMRPVIVSGRLGRRVGCELRGRGSRSAVVLTVVLALLL